MSLPLFPFKSDNVFDAFIKNPGASQCLNTVFLIPDISVD